MAAPPENILVVTNAQYDIAAIGQLYRDRCDCENGIDELKNQRGWGGFTTQERVGFFGHGGLDVFQERGA